MNKTVTFLWLSLVLFLLFSGMRIPIGHDVLRHECQPGNIFYNASRTQHCVAMVKTKYITASQCIIRISRKDDIETVNYAYSFPAPADCETIYWTVWDNDGVNIFAQLYKGDKHPIKMYVSKAAFVD